jgi:hypothetical protein
VRLENTMKRSFVLLVLFWLFPSGARTGEKLHGKIIAADGTRVEIMFTVQPQSTVIELDGNAVGAVGDYVEFGVREKNSVEVNGRKLTIREIRWTP